MSGPLVLVGVLLYFALVSLVLGLCMLPSWRDTARAVGSRLLGLARPAPAARAAAPGAVAAPAGSVDPFPPRHAWVALLTAAAIAAGPATALMLRDRIPGLGGGEIAGNGSDEHVASAFAEPPRLRGAPAVAVALPQPAAPPAADPGGADPARDWSLLDPRLRERLLTVFEIARQRHGYELVLLEGWRSPERQAELAAMVPARTLAGPHQSLHQAGLAADVAFRRDGRLVVSDADPWAREAYRHYGDIARSMGLIWGGDWQSLKDLGHVEWRQDKRPENAGPAPVQMIASR